MEKLKQAILEKGIFIGNDIVKIDSFLNHQIDPELVEDIGSCFADYFKKHNITKVVTIESSGIAPAFICALRLHVPMVFIKKTNPSTMLNPLTASVHSFTKNKTYTICMDKDYISEHDRILFIDDFLANGEAFRGFEEIVAQANATIVGVGIVVEKSFQKGHDYIVNKGYDMCCLASIASLHAGKVEFK